MIRDIEELSMNAWPSLQTNLFDGWILRFSQGYTKRANSINPIYPSAFSIEDKIKYCENAYSNKDLPTIYKITEACYPKNLDQILENKGYQKIDETSVRLLNIAANYTIEEIGGLDIEYNFTEEWINAFADCSSISDNSKIEVMTQMLMNIIGDKICVKVRLKDDIIACGFGVIENNHIGIFDIIVSKDSRGNGYGKAIIQRILKEAQMRNISKSYLQVVVGNTIAENLYSNLGFKEIYRYWYRIKHC